MRIDFAFRAYYYIYKDLIKKTKHIGKELNEYLSNKDYVTGIELTELSFKFINTQNFKCRVRPKYIPIHDVTKAYEAYVMALFFEIPMPEVEFIKVSDEDRPTYIGKALMKVLESQDVPTKIRKQFDRERFIADVRDFFVNVKGCKLD